MARRWIGRCIEPIWSAVGGRAAYTFDLLRAESCSSQKRVSFVDATTRRPRTLFGTGGRDTAIPPAEQQGSSGHGRSSVETATASGNPEVTPTASFDSKTGKRVVVTVPARYEDLAQDFSLPEGNRVPAGIYRFVGGTFQYNSSQRSRFRPSFSVGGGHFYHGRQLLFSFTPGWSPSRHFRADATYRMDHVTFSARDAASRRTSGVFGPKRCSRPAGPPPRSSNTTAVTTRRW